MDESEIVIQQPPPLLLHFLLLRCQRHFLLFTECHPHDDDGRRSFVRWDLKVFPKCWWVPVTLFRHAMITSCCATAAAAHLQVFPDTTLEASVDDDDKASSKSLSSRVYNNYPPKEPLLSIRELPRQSNRSSQFVDSRLCDDTEQ